MPFKPGREPVDPDFKRLLGTLNRSSLRDKDNPLYQVIKSLIDWGQQQNVTINSKFEAVNQAIAGISIVVNVDENGDDGGSETILGYYEPVTNGDPLYPEILFDSNGEVIMGFVSLE